MPSEHGGWSLSSEPAILGLWVAFSWSGLFIGIAALVAFIARTPIKVALVDRFRHRSTDRTKLAVKFALGELAVLVLLAVGAVALAEPWFWVPIAIAAPLIAIELWYDMRSRSRRLIPELAGAIGIGSVAAAIALADGTTTALALALWCIIAARATAAIVYVRVQLARAHGRDHELWHSDLVQLAAVAAVAIACLADAIPVLPVVAMAGFAVWNIASVRLPVRPPKILGLQQMAAGLFVIAVSALAINAAA